MAWYDSNWSTRFEITSDAAYIDEDIGVYTFPLSSIAIAVPVPEAFWDVVNATDGRDIRMTESDGETEIPVEIVGFDSSSETGLLHFKTSLSTSVDESVYIYIGNGAATMPAVDSTYGAENVWADFIQVLHLTETGGTVAVDSTDNDNDSDTPSGTMTSGDNVAGPSSDWPGLAFDGSDDVLKTSSATGFDTDAISFSAWLKKDASSSGYIYGGGTDFTVGNRRFRLDDMNYGAGYFRPNVYFTFSGAEGHWRADTAGEFPAMSTWFHFVVSYDGSSASNDPVVYIDGSAMTLTENVAPSGTRSTGVDSITVPARNDSASPWPGTLAGVRWINSAVTANFVTTQVAMESDPGSFWTVGVDEAYGNNTGWQYPDSVSTDAGGDGETWSDTGNIQALSGEASVEDIDSAGNVTDYLIGAFAFSIPTDATPDGIEVRYRARANTTNDMEEKVCQIEIGGTRVGTNKSTGVQFTTLTAIYERGGVADLWDLTPTATELNTMGLAFQAEDGGGGSGDDIWIQSIEARVWYTPSAGGSDATASGDVDLGGLTVEGTVYGDPSASGDVDLGGLTVEGDVSVDYATANGDVDLGGLVVSGTVYGDASASGDVELGGLTVDGSASLTLGPTASGAVDLGGLTVEGVVAPPAVASGDVDLGGLIASGSFAVGASVSGDVDLGGLTVEGVVAPPAVASGDVGLGGLTVEGTVYGDASASGDVDLGGLTVSGIIGSDGHEAFGDVALGGLTVAGTAVTGSIPVETLPRITLDDVSWYLTGASSPGASQRDPALSLGGNRANVVARSMTWDVRDPMVGIEILSVAGGNGRGAGILEAVTESSLSWTPPGGQPGAPVTLLEGDEAGLYGLNGSGGIRVRRRSTLPLTGRHTVKCLDIFNNVVGFGNVPSADAIAGETYHRAVMAVNLYPGPVISLRLWLDPDANPGLAIGYELAVDGAIQTIADETTAPTGITWHTGTTSVTGLFIPSLPQGAAFGLWMRRTVAADSDPSPSLLNHIHVEISDSIATVSTAHRGRYRVAREDWVTNGVWVGSGAPPDLDAAPDETFTATPHTTDLDVSAGTYDVVARSRNKWGLWGAETRDVVVIEADGSQGFNPPSAPTDVVITQTADNEPIVGARYEPAPDGETVRAAIFVIWMTADGSTPDPEDSPTAFSIMRNSRVGIELLRWPSTTELLDGTPVKALVRTRRLAIGAGDVFAPDTTQLPASGAGTIVVAQELSGWDSTGFLKVTTPSGGLQEVIEYDDLVVGSGISTFTVLSGGRAQWGTSSAATAENTLIYPVAAVDSTNTDSTSGTIDGLVPTRPWGDLLFADQAAQQQAAIEGPDGSTEEYIDEGDNIYLLLGEGWCELWMDTTLVWKVFQDGNNQTANRLYIPVAWDIVADAVGGAGSGVFEAAGPDDLYLCAADVRQVHIDASAMTITAPEISTLGGLPEVAPQASSWEQYAGSLLQSWDPQRADWRPYLQVTASGAFNSQWTLDNSLSQAEVLAL